MLSLTGEEKIVRRTAAGVSITDRDVSGQKIIT
jgi:hypothetical protein